MTMRALASDLPIVLQDVSHQVRGVAVLAGVSLTIAPGAPTVVIGPNGAGKTTLLRVMMGLIGPSAGVVTWGGRTAVPATRRAIVLQRPTMLRRSASANIRYALGSAGIARAQWPARTEYVLALVGLADLSERPARRLSGGEQQRLALARALARDPEVILLDEPTASLDPAATRAIEDVVRTVAASRIKVVMSTHDLGEARRLAGDVVFLHHGRVIESGPAATFFDHPSTSEARRFLAGELLD